MLTYTADGLEKIFREENINPDELQNMVVEKLTKNNLKLATAESCTGGLVAEKITNVPGSSEVFGYGFVTYAEAEVFDCGVCSYANKIKHKVLGVSEETLNTLGAVSPETALQMAEGVKKLANADIGASTTGIAGPTGGTDEKPVGLVYVGICANCSKFPVKLLLGETNGSKNSRNYIRKLACNAVLYTIWKLT